MTVGVDEQIYSTASRRRRLVAEALSHHLDPAVFGSTASKLAPALDRARPLLVSADIDGLVTATMLASVAPEWKVIGFVQESAATLLHPDYLTIPDDVFAIDLFSPQFDGISNHPVLYGNKKLQNVQLRNALQAWDSAVRNAWGQRTYVVPSLWADIEAGYEGAKQTTSAKYKYPLGSAQIVLALLESIGRAPKFYDRSFLPWLVANCDGGASSHINHPYNTSVWWSALAAIVGPGSLTERVFDRVDTMRPHDLLSAINGLHRERDAAGKPQVLRNNWNLVGIKADTLRSALSWLIDLAVWPDPVKGGIESLETWVRRPTTSSGLVYIDKEPKPNQTNAINAKTDTAAAAQSLQNAANRALNANFYVGGQSGSRFNWVGL